MAQAADFLAPGFAMQVGNYMAALPESEDRATLLESPSRSRSVGRTAIPWLCAAFLLAAGYGSREAWSRSQSRMGAEVLGEEQQFSTTTLRYRFILRGPVNYNSLAGSAANQKTFRDTVAAAIVKHAQVSNLKVTVDPNLIEYTNANPGKNLARTEVVAEIVVPPQVDAAALMKRLQDRDPTTKKTLNQVIVTDIGAAALPGFTAGSMESLGGSFSSTSQKETLYAEGDADSANLIHVKVDIKGVYYSLLTTSADTKAKFAQAVQSGIAQSSSQSVDAGSIALDISDGSANNLASPFVHVEAKIPVPSSLKVDASMSEWPGGSAGLAAAVQAKLRAMTGIEQVTTKAGVSQVVEVSAGDLLVGSVREMYATKVSLQVSIHPLKTGVNGAGDTVFRAELAEELQKLAASKAGVAKEDVAFTCTENPVGGKNVDCTGDFKAKGTSGLNTKVSEWESKLFPMSREFQQNVLTKYKTKVDDVTKFIVQVGIGSVANVPDSVDIDLAIHGIEYSEIPANRKRKFLKDLSEQVQAAVKAANPGNAEIVATEKKIRTVVTATSDATLNVLIQVPVTDAAVFTSQAKISAAATALETNKNALITQLQTKVQAMPEADFVSTWTSKAIIVQSPGEV